MCNRVGRFLTLRPARPGLVRQFCYSGLFNCQLPLLNTSKFELNPSHRVWSSQFGEHNQLKLSQTTVYHGTVETVLHSNSCGREKTTGPKFHIDGALFSTSSPAYCGYSCSILGKNWDNRISWVLLIKGVRICFISISWKKLNYYGFTV